jgi:putative sugar O-methyltransferase
MTNFLKKLYNIFSPFFLGIYSFAIYIFKYRKYRAVPLLKKGIVDNRNQFIISHPQYTSIFERLIKAYYCGKKNQETTDKPYRVGKLWQNLLDIRFDKLSTALGDRDISAVKALLENFHREKCTEGAGGAFDDYIKMRKDPLYKYQFINTWYNYYHKYMEISNNDEELRYPLVGNPAGLYYNEQVIPLDALRYYYYATEINSLLKNINNPVICEIGGGVGGQAYAILTTCNNRAKYILLDIPEILLLASYFLMATLSEKKFLLYGENPLNSETIEQYDTILMPNFVLPQLADQSVDLFFNACSFSEMDKVTVEEYLNQIERIGRKYFMHINHNIPFILQDAEGNKITNLKADQIIPAPAQFKRVYKHPRVFARLEDKLFYYYHKAGHFAFLYERIKPLKSKK